MTSIRLKLFDLLCNPSNDGTLFSLKAINSTLPLGQPDEATDDFELNESDVTPEDDGGDGVDLSRQSRGKLLGNDTSSHLPVLFGTQVNTHGKVNDDDYKEGSKSCCDYPTLCVPRMPSVMALWLFESGDGLNRHISSFCRTSKPSSDIAKYSEVSASSSSTFLSSFSLRSHSFGDIALHPHTRRPDSHSMWSH